MAKFDPFLSMDCARVEAVGAQSKERKGSNFEAQHSGAIVFQARRAKHIQSKNLAIAIWQPWPPPLPPHAGHGEVSCNLATLALPKGDKRFMVFHSLRVSKRQRMNGY